VSEESVHNINYVKIWAILIVLLIVSLIGPLFEIQIVTLISAFGIAVVKAQMVAKYFMHIGHAAQYILYLVLSSLVLMLLFFAGTAPDVMQPDGQLWVKPSWDGADVQQSPPQMESPHP